MCLYVTLWGFVIDAMDTGSGYWNAVGSFVPFK